jgi:hypothetical protein
MTNSPHCALSTGYKEKYIEEMINAKFLGLQIDNHLIWKNHTDQMIPNLSGACYTVKSIYFAFELYNTVWNTFLG